MVPVIHSRREKYTRSICTAHPVLSVHPIGRQPPSACARVRQGASESLSALSALRASAHFSEGQFVSRICHPAFVIRHPAYSIKWCTGCLERFPLFGFSSAVPVFCLCFLCLFSLSLSAFSNSFKGERLCVTVSYIRPVPNGQSQF